MPRQPEKHKLLAELDDCLQHADQLGLLLVGIHISHAIDLLRADVILEDLPRGNVK